MSSFFDQCEKIVCINRDDRPDRWKAAQEEFKKVGLADRVERYSAKVGLVGDPWTKARKGISASYIDLLTKAGTDKLKNILILQDDLFFISEVPNLLMPADFEIFYLGFKPAAGIEVAGDFIRLKRDCLHLQAAVFNSSAYQLVIDAIKWYACLSVDIPIAKKVLGRNRCYGFNPPVVIQSNSKSNLRPTSTLNHSHRIVDDYNKQIAKVAGGKPITFKVESEKAIYVR